MANPGKPEYQPISVSINVTKQHIYDSCRHCYIHTNKYTILKGLNANHVDMDARIVLCVNCFETLKDKINNPKEI